MNHDWIVKIMGLSRRLVIFLPKYCCVKQSFVKFEKNSSTLSCLIRSKNKSNLWHNIIRDMSRILGKILRNSSKFPYSLRSHFIEIFYANFDAKKILNLLDSNHLLILLAGRNRNIEVSIFLYPTSILCTKAYYIDLYWLMFHEDLERINLSRILLRKNIPWNLISFWT